MKKLTVLITAGLLSATLTFGQFNTGNGYLSGMTNTNLGFEFQQSYSDLILGIHTEAGYFIKNRWSVGGSLLGDFCINLSGLESTIDFLIGPNTRYYLARDTGPQIYIFGFAGYGVQQIADEGYMLHHSIGVKVGPGVTIFLTERLALDARGTYFFRYFWNPEFGGSHNNHKILFEIGFSVFFSEFSFEL